MSDSQPKLEQYLLGEMPEAEQTALEQTYFNDPAMFDLLAAVETDLVDRYARGLLSPVQRARFEQHYLTHSARRERAQFAEALAKRIDSIPTPAPIRTARRAETSWSRLISSLQIPKLAWVTTLLLLFVAAGGWLYLRNKERRELAEARPPQIVQPQPTEGSDNPVKTGGDNIQHGPAENPSPVTSPRVRHSVSFALTVADVRGGDARPAQVLTIPSGTDDVRLVLKLRENDYSTYEIVVQPIGGSEILRRSNLAPIGQTARAEVIVAIPATRFAGGDYILTLKGVTKAGEMEDVSRLLFRVVKN